MNKIIVNKKKICSRPLKKGDIYLVKGTATTEVCMVVYCNGYSFLGLNNGHWFCGVYDSLEELAKKTERYCLEFLGNNVTISIDCSNTNT